MATVAVNEFVFRHPVRVGDILSFFSSVTRVGRTSITVEVEVYAERFAEQGNYVKGDRGAADLCGHRRRRAPSPPARALISEPGKIGRALGQEGRHGLGQFRRMQTLLQSLTFACQCGLQRRLVALAQQVLAAAQGPGAICASVWRSAMPAASGPRGFHGRHQPALSAVAASKGSPSSTSSLASRMPAFSGSR